MYMMCRARSRAYSFMLKHFDRSIIMTMIAQICLCLLQCSPPIHTKRITLALL